MSELWTAACCAAGDFVGGWLLSLPRDATLCLLAACSAGLALALRRYGTNQELLRRVRHDQRQLQRLVREARAAADRPNLTRYRRTAAVVAGLRFRQELRSLLLSMLPLAILMTWAAERLAYLPPEPGESLEFVAWFPSSAVGEVVHLVPSGGLDAAPGWVRQVVATRRAGATCGTAAWTLRSAAHASPADLTLRFRGQSFHHPLRPGQSIPPPMQYVHGDDVETALKLREYRPLGIGRFRLWPLPPWLTAYSVLVLTAYVAGKRWLGIG